MDDFPANQQKNNVLLPVFLAEQQVHALVRGAAWGELVTSPQRRLGTDWPLPDGMRTPERQIPRPSGIRGKCHQMPGPTSSVPFSAPGPPASDSSQKLSRLSSPHPGLELVHPLICSPVSHAHPCGKVCQSTHLIYFANLFCFFFVFIVGKITGIPFLCSTLTPLPGRWPAPGLLHTTVCVHG